MNKLIFGALLGVACLVSLPAAYALPGDGMFDPGTTRFTVDAGLTAGGDKLATITYIDGSDQSIYAGNALYADVGFLHNFAASNWSLKGTVGYAFYTVHADNGDFTFDHEPVDLIAIYNHGRHHFGVGVTYQISPHLDLDGFGPNADFNNAAGIVLQYQYWLFGVRYTNIRYTVSSGCNLQCSFDGSNIGVFFNYAF